MALSETERGHVRRFLGYSDSSAGLYSLLEGRMSSLSTVGVTQTQQLLEDLLAIEEQLRNDWRLQRAKRAEEVELWGFDGILSLWEEGNRLASQLARMLGVTLDAMPFGGAPSSGMAGRG